MVRLAGLKSSLIGVMLAGTIGVATADDPSPTPPDEPAAPAVEPKQAKATVHGLVLDNNTKVGLPAAAIQIKGGAAGDQTFATDLDGGYTIELAPGTYTVVFSTPEYVEQT